MTDRQMAAWEAWLEADYNHPSRTDHYLMGLRCEVARVLSKDKRRYKDEHYKLRFTTKRKPRLTKEQRAETTRLTHLGAMGIDLGAVKVVRVKRSQLPKEE